jgi:hypothetical protein
MVLSAVLLTFAAVASVFAGGQPELLEATELEDGFREVEPGDGYRFAWQVGGDALSVRISAPTTGWVAVGFEPSRAMRDADMRLGFIADGTATMEDHFGTSAVTHEADTALGGSNDLSNVSGTEDDERTTLSFTMPLETGDEYDAALDPGSEVVLIYAYGADGEDNYSRKHVARGGFRIQL